MNEPVSTGNNQANGRAGLYLKLAAGFLFSVGLVWLGTLLGRESKPTLDFPPLNASSAMAADNLAVATGAIDDDAEGIFFLDFNTGDLQCLVFYPRAGAFGARFYTNVAAQVGGGKNSKYLLVTGQAIARGGTVGPRPAGSLVYVTDVTTGMFAAYAVPWNKNAESSGRVQTGPLVFAGGGPIRNYQVDDTLKKATPIVEPKP